MKKSYQKRLDSLVGEDLKDQVPEEVPEIEDLDSILALPKPLREMSFVKAACKAHKKSTNKKAKKQKTCGTTPALEEWQETPGKSESFNNRN